MSTRLAAHYPVRVLVIPSPSASARELLGRLVSFNTTSLRRACEQIANSARMPCPTIVARIAIEHGSDDPEALAWAACVIGAAGRDIRGAISLAEKALAHNPNSAIALLTMGRLQVHAGDNETGISYLDRTARLNPLEGSGVRDNTVSIAHLNAGRYEAAVEFAKKALQDNPNYAPPLGRLAAVLGLLGRIDEAREAVQRLLAISPDQTISRVRAYFESQGAVVKLDVLCEGLRRAGLPE